MRGGAPWRRWVSAGALVLAAAIVGFVWYGKPTPPEHSAVPASGAPLNLRLDRELHK